MLPRDFSRRVTVGTCTLSASISPCSWMYPGHGLQIQVVLEETGARGFARIDTPFEKATEADIEAMLGGYQITACARCGGPRFAYEEHQGNRGELCERCFMSDLNAELKKAQEKEQRTVARRDANHKKKGYTHRVTAWVHPPRGSDYQIDVYYKGEPSKADIHAVLREKRSAELDQYTVVAL